MKTEFTPRRARLVDKGWESYTGYFGTAEFVEGVSVERLTWQEQHRIGSVVKLVDADDADFHMNPAASYDRSRALNADDKLVRDFQTGEALKTNPNLLIDTFTQEQLQEIADKEGLNGVREIARQRGKTGRSIKECIDAIIAAQEEANPKKEEPEKEEIDLEEVEETPTPETREEITPSEVTKVEAGE